MADEKPKLSGMEMMVNSLLRAAGFNPVEIQQAMTAVISQVTKSLKECSDSLASIHEEQRKQRAMLEAIMKELRIPALCSSDMDESAVSSAPRIIQQ